LPQEHSLRVAARVVAEMEGVDLTSPRITIEKLEAVLLDASGAAARSSAGGPPDEE
jgi:hypothetical protein